MTIMYRVDKVPRCDLRKEYTVPCKQAYIFDLL